MAAARLHNTGAYPPTNRTAVGVGMSREPAVRCGRCGNDLKPRERTFICDHATPAPRSLPFHEATPRTRDLERWSAYRVAHP